MKNYAFFPVLMFFICVLSSMSLFAFSTWWHMQATRLALENRFSSDARLLAQFANYLVDYHSTIDAYVAEPMRKVNLISTYRVSREDLIRLHFDNLFSTAQIEYQWGKLEENTIRALEFFNSAKTVRPGFRKIVLLSIVGASLHTVQDFYAHSNWIDLLVGSDQQGLPTWFELESNQRKILRLYSGAYPDGREKGMVNHADLNKDNSQRKLHDIAYQVAVRASKEWIERLINKAKIDWPGLFSYKVKTLPEKRWLSRTDATFIMATAVLAGELDGSEPSVSVFNSERHKEKVQATAALSLVISDYSSSFLLFENPYKLPTPNWCGFYLYHLEKELARDLLPLRKFQH